MVFIYNSPEFLDCNTKIASLLRMNEKYDKEEKIHPIPNVHIHWDMKYASVNTRQPFALIQAHQLN